MNILKTTLAAGAIAVAALASTTAADAATRVVVGNHGHVAVVHKPAVHRAAVVYRAPIAISGGWYAEPAGYHPYTYYRANPRLRACFAVTQRGLSGQRHVMFGATMCYGKNGIRYVVPTSRHIVRWL